MKTGMLTAIAMVAGSAVFVAVPPLGAAGKTTMDGVYTEAQAARGKAQYEEICSACHGPTLDGAPFTAPTLKGIPFAENWRDEALGTLFQKIKNDMPMGSPDRMGDRDKLDVLTYLLKYNGLKAGNEELTMAAVDSIVFASPLPRQPVKDGSLVRMIGCLAKEGTQFVLGKATDAVKSREGLPSSDAQLVAAAAVPLGTGTFQLMDPYPPPDAHVGKRVDVKGILMLQPGVSKLNVTALQSTGASCQ